MVEVTLTETDEERTAEQIGPVLDKKMEATIAQLDDFIKLHEENHSGRVLRDRQFEVFRDLRHFLAEGGREGYVKLPTGFGKTVLFSKFVQATGLRSLIVVPTQILVDQTEEKMSRFTDLDTGKVYSRAKDYSRAVTVTTYQSLVPRVESGEIRPDEYGLLILDEVHKSLSARRIGAIDKFSSSIKLGFTATPYYSGEKSVSNLLKTEIHSLGVKEATEEGYLAEFAVYIAETSVDLSDVPIATSGEYQEKALQRVINAKARNRSAVDLYTKFLTGQRAIAFCAGVKHSEDLAREFNKVGVNAVSVSGQDSARTQSRIREEFDNGEIDILCSADLLVEGFDNTGVSVALNLRPVRSFVMAEQRGGRVLRLDPDNPGKVATIIDFFDHVDDPRKRPISFADVVGAARAKHLKKPQGAQNNAGTPPLPLEFPDFLEIPNLKVTTSASEVLKILRNIDHSVEKIEGWMTTTEVALLIKAGYTRIRNVADAHREANPEWFKGFLNSQKQIIEHYSPELIEIIKREVTETQERYSDAPEGWMTVNGLKSFLLVGQSRISKMVEEARKSNPEWIKSFRNRNLQVWEYLSPDLVSIIASKIATDAYERPSFNPMKDENLRDFFDKAPRVQGPIVLDEIPPSSWVTVGDIVNKTGLSSETARSWANELSVVNVDHRAYMEDDGHRHYYDPHVLEKILAKINETLSEPPEGWMLPREVAYEVRLGDLEVNGIVRKYRESHADWIQNFRVKSGRVFEYLHPDLVAAIYVESDLLAAYKESSRDFGVTIESDGEIKITLNEDRISKPERRSKKLSSKISDNSQKIEADIEDFLLAGDSVGTLLNHAKKFSQLTREQVSGLIATMRGEDLSTTEGSERAQQARDLIFDSNIKLVVWMANKFRGRGLELADLISEGSIGLMTAIGKYEAEKGSFSTYAFYWIKQAIMRAIENQSRAIRVPVHAISDTIIPLSRAQRDFTVANGTYATVQELAEYLGWDVERVKTGLRMNARVKSISTPIDGNDANSRTIGDRLADSYDLEGEVIEDSLKNQRDRISKQLNILLSEILEEREFDIIARRFGFNGYTKQTLEEAAEHYNITRERIRQIEQKAIEKIAASKSAEEFLYSFNLLSQE